MSNALRGLSPHVRILSANSGYVSMNYSIRYCQLLLSSLRRIRIYLQGLKKVFTRWITLLIEIYGVR